MRTHSSYMSLPCTLTGPKVRGGSIGLDNNIRRESQPPTPPGSHGDGIDHFRGGKHALIWIHVKHRRANEHQFPCKNYTAMLLEHGHHISISSVPHRDLGPHAHSQCSVPEDINPIPGPISKWCSRFRLDTAYLFAAALRADALKPVEILGDSDVGRRWCPIFTSKATIHAVVDIPG